MVIKILKSSVKRHDYPLIDFFLFHLTLANRKKKDCCNSSFPQQVSEVDALFGSCDYTLNFVMVL